MKAMKEKAMKVNDTRNAVAVADGFAAWYKAEIARYVARCDATEAADVEAIVRNVSYFVLGRLVTELGSVGVSVSQIIKFLSRHAQS
jgi:hypothetical protein